MLARLEIRDFALIREADLDLAPGLNALTGATGVGKTLVLAALDLLLGGRARADRLGPDGSASVAGLFQLPPRLASDIAREAECEIEDGELLVRRTVETGGRNRCSVNGVMTTVATLRAIGERLIDIHGQNEHQSLLHPAAQLEILDRFAGLEEERGEYASMRAELVGAVERLADLARGRDERASRLDYLDHIVSEIEEAAPRPGERQEIETALRRLREAERYREALAIADDLLYEGDLSASSVIAGVVRRLQDIADLDPEVAKLAEGLEEARVSVEETAFALRECNQEADDDPARLEEIESRLDLLHDLCRKHGGTEEDVLRVVEEASAEIFRLQADEQDLGGLRARIQELAAGLGQAGDRLVASRLKTGKTLARDVGRELADLGMKGASLTIVHRPPPADDDPLAGTGPTGPGRFEFLVATNPGAEPGPLQRIASGGELARIMLALKGRLARADRVPVLVFDEIDANVGGRLGAVVGAKMAALGASRQVLCVTHLPQIAAYADRHLQVTKASGKTEAVTRVVALDDEERETELAEMLGAGDAARAQARALLKDARATVTRRTKA